MLLLLPTTSEQEFNIIPRDPNELTLLNLTITEDGSRNSETFTDITAFENGDYICIAQAFTILKEHRTYEIRITQDGNNWYRDKARCTSQVDKAVKHSLNTVADNGFLTLETNSDFTTIE